MGNAAVTLPFNHVAFLRAINVGGRRVTNQVLAEIALTAGFARAEGYQASGNLLLSVDGELDAELLESTLMDALGYEVPVMARSAERVTAIASARPFSEEQLAQTAGKVQVIFLRDDQTAATKAAVETTSSPLDELRLDGAVIYWLPRDGISTSELKVDHLAKLVGPLTVRTQGTIARLARKLVL